MKIFSTFIIGCVFGALGASDIDINRIKQISNRIPKDNPEQTYPNKNYRSILRSNDYDDHSSWNQRAPLPTIGTAEATKPKKTVQIYQAREDPRLYYQSDAYLKDFGRKNVNEVAFVYPGHHVVRAEDEAGRSQLSSAEMSNFAAPQEKSMCVQCPHDLTLVAKASLRRVVLQSPTIRTCSGLKAPRYLRFVHMYGPHVGSLLEQGSHMIIGHIMDKNKSLKLCKMQVHVVTQGCVTPKYLTAHCWNKNKQCNFTCTNNRFEISGPNTQFCGDDMKWKGALPICKVRTWCALPPPPKHGHVSCHGAPTGDGLAEGSRCRVKCARGFHSSRVTPVCRRGSWTHDLICQPIRKRNASTAVVSKH